MVSHILNHPLTVFAIALVAQGIAAYAGDLLRRRWRPVRSDEREDLRTVLTASFTLLSLLIGFSFSMAVTRYDQRKNYEEAEANAIGTEYVRADLLPAADSARVREVLTRYLDNRIASYVSREEIKIGQVDTSTATLQAELWSAILPASQAQPTIVTALAVSGMNDVLNSEGYTQGAWWNRIPVAAWELMGLIAIACNLLHGYSERQKRRPLLLVVPIIVSISFSLIADVDSPGGGLIRVHPNNLMALSHSLKAQ